MYGTSIHQSMQFMIVLKRKNNLWALTVLLPKCSKINHCCINFKKRKWVTLPSMNTGRWFHTCARVQRYNSEYIVAMGGVSNINANIFSVEYYDLTNRPSLWETDSSKHLSISTYINFPPVSFFPILKRNKWMLSKLAFLELYSMLVLLLKLLFQINKVQAGKFPNQLKKG